MLRVITTALFVLTTYGFTHAQSTDTSGYADIRMLMVAMNAQQSSTAAMKAMRGPIRDAMPNVPDDVFNEMFDDMQTSTNDGELLELVVAIYAKHFTRSEIKELLKFYASPVGKTLARVSPQINSESIQAGQQWGQAMMMRFIQKLKARGYDPVRKM